MSACKNCLKILVCKYNDGHNLFCKEDYKCPHFLDISTLEKQIPKKPSETDKARCIHCACVVKRDERFCKNCGQALDWSE